MTDQKPSKGLMEFELYTSLSPIVLNIYLFLKEYKSIIPEEYVFNTTVTSVFDTLTFLSKGCAKYHSDDKSLDYIHARECVSIIQSNLLSISVIASAIPKDQLFLFYNQLQEKLSHLNGVIKKMETKNTTSTNKFNFKK